MAKVAMHIPCIIKRHSDTTYGVYCLACSESARDYVAQCNVVPPEDWPPLLLIAVPEAIKREKGLKTT